MANKVVVSNNAPSAIGPYSQAIRTPENSIFVSGQLGLNPKTGDFDADDIKVQTKQSLENLKSILEVEGYSLSDVVKTTVLLKDIGEFADMNAIYSEYFKEPYPARSAFQVVALPKGGRVEIEAIAVKE